MKRSIRAESHPPHASPARGRRLAWALAGAAAIVLAGLYVAATHSVGAFSLPQPMMVLPPLLLLAFALSLRAWPAHKGEPATQTPPATQAPPDAMDWPSLSRLASRFFAERGLADLSPGQPWQEGAARTLRKGARTWVVHADQWQAAELDAPAVSLLARDVARRGADGGVLLCASDAFTPAARQLAAQCGILLLDSSRLRGAAGKEAPVPAQRPARATPPLPATAAAPVPAAAPAPVNRVPVLRPDHEVRVRRDFQPTEPMARGALKDHPGSTGLPPLTASEALSLAPGDAPVPTGFLPTEMASAGRHLA
ncbi:MAG: restriction endonuclease [Ottowia sp.]|uniref:restriction endonuclease n=1 Tax=Ottowia sp. TaxID=1898956 RepID=UPI0039E500AB